MNMGCKITKVCGIKQKKGGAVTLKPPHRLRGYKIGDLTDFLGFAKSAGLKAATDAGIAFHFHV
jgi:hypothetical protein